ncbi:MAG: two-component sensor histidine kinase [Lachnospiraceae bacterium]|nr:two-component sensor histidine kinase [Lachnospiraceae bacterium]
MINSISKAFARLNVKVLVLVCLSAIIPTIIISVVIDITYLNRSIQSECENLYTKSEVLSKQIITSGYLDDQSDVTMETRLDELAQLIDGRVILVTSSLRVVYDSYSLVKGKIFLWENVTKSAAGEELAHYDSEGGIITTTIPVTVYEEGSDETKVVGVLLASGTYTYIKDNLDHLIAIEAILLLMITVLSIVVGSIVGSSFSLPIREASKQFDRGIKGDEIGEIDATGYEEIEGLSHRFNTYVSKMETIDKSRQEFVSNVSHELKTPLASMKVLADSLVGMGDAPIELYQEFMNDITNEIDRETGIIEDLLAMVRMDKSGVSLNIKTVNINELTEQILKRLRPIAEKAQIELVLESFRPINAEVDEVKLSLAISNLIENGIKYNNPGGYVHISLNSDHQYFYIKVEDSGMGIPKESLDMIFERFYRVDKSHSREIGGTGLGLAITHMAVIMHNGEIMVDSIVDEGTTFDVRIPLTHIEGERS